MIATILAGRVRKRPIGPLQCRAWGHGSTIRQPGVASLSGRRGTRLADEEVRLGVTNGEVHNLWQLPVDLEWVATVLEADPMRCHGAFLDLETGEIIPYVMPGSEMVGEDVAENRGAEPDRWLFLPCLGSRAVRQDMAEL